jgi:hypothetical protein
LPLQQWFAKWQQAQQVISKIVVRLSSFTQVAQPLNVNVDTIHLIEKQLNQT